RASLTSIGLCIGGIFVFVLFAALYAVETPLEERQLFVLLAILLVVLIVVGAAWLVFRQRAGALFYISAAGVLYGFVATLAKVVIKRFQAADI
ncbi:multidrug DMT transporter permease, partial [bacterium LRH843]|nr:multidrug DMT transporter permease [bacterium LRH843]